VVAGLSNRVPTRSLGANPQTHLTLQPPLSPGPKDSSFDAGRPSLAGKRIPVGAGAQGAADKGPKRNRLG
jgi:hypothetical protein